MNFFQTIIGTQKPLKLSPRDAEGIEDGLLWALGCLDGLTSSPVRVWLAAHQGAFDTLPALAPAPAIWERLALNAPLRPQNAPADNSLTADPSLPRAALEVGQRLIDLSGKRVPLWWADSWKPAHMLALILGLGRVFTARAIDQLPTDQSFGLLSDNETGYALALIAEFSGHEPKAALRALDAKVLEGFASGRSHLSRDLDLRNDLHALTTGYDRAKVR